MELKISRLRFNLLPILIFCLMASFAACEVEEEKPEDPCENVVCNNSGICFNGACVCSDGYAGPSCNTKVGPSAVIISSIKILRFPAKQSDGSDWDNTSTGRPDLMIRIFRFTSLVHEQASSSVISNATSSGSNTYNPPTNIVLTSETTEHSIALYDYDGGSGNPADYMGEATFTPYLAARPGFPSTLLVDTGGSVAYELTLDYVY